MSIQWYPGHMTAAKKKAEEAMEFNDVIIEAKENAKLGKSVLINVKIGKTDFRKGSISV